MGYSVGNPNWQTPEDWLKEDTEDPGYQVMADDEIISGVVGERSINDSFSCDDDEESDSQSSMSDTQACKAFDVALKWLESRHDKNPVHLLLVKKWRDTAVMN